MHSESVSNKVVISLRQSICVRNVVEGVESHQDDLVEEPGEAAMLQVNGSCQVTSQKEVRGGRHRLEEKKLKGKGGAVFSAMMMDSSSEEENSDDEDEAVEEENKPRVVSQQQSNFLKPTKTAKSAGSVVKNNKSVTNGSIVSSSNNTRSTDVDPTQPQSKKSKSKKKKKGKSKQSSNAEEDGDETKEDVSTNTVANRKATTLSAGDSTVSNSLVDFWQSLLLPLVMALASFIVSIVTGLFTSDKAKKGGKKKRG
mmetsp:Transcript_22431/g.48784  ORF Transcript_22431/g.48784 Transcript_22431/m.48784 type:complete len:255 (-) Transcript_22431:88-852(-)